MHLGAHLAGEPFRRLPFDGVETARVGDLVLLDGTRQVEVGHFALPLLCQQQVVRGDVPMHIPLQNATHAPSDLNQFFPKSPAALQ